MRGSLLYVSLLLMAVLYQWRGDVPFLIHDDDIWCNFCYAAAEAQRASERHGGRAGRERVQLAALRQLRATRLGAEPHALPVREPNLVQDTQVSGELTGENKSNYVVIFNVNLEEKIKRK